MGEKSDEWVNIEKQKINIVRNKIPEEDEKEMEEDDDNIQTQSFHDDNIKNITKPGKRKNEKEVSIVFLESRNK